MTNPCAARQLPFVDNTVLSPLLSVALEEDRFATWVDTHELGHVILFTKRTERRFSLRLQYSFLRCYRRGWYTQLVVSADYTLKPNTFFRWMKHAIRSSLESHSFSYLSVKLVITPLLIHNLALSTLGIQTLLLVVVGLLCEDHSLIYSTYQNNSHSYLCGDSIPPQGWTAQTTVWYPCCHQSCTELPSFSIPSHFYIRKSCKIILNCCLDGLERKLTRASQISSFNGLIHFVYRWSFFDRIALRINSNLFFSKKRQFSCHQIMLSCHAHGRC